MENRYVGLFSDVEVSTAGRVVDRFFRRYEVFFGSLDFEDLLQECLFYFHRQKKEYWLKAEAYGMSYRGYVAQSCSTCLKQILRSCSTKGRKQAAALHRDYGHLDIDHFNDAGDFNIMENLFVSSVFVDAEGQVILQDACLRVYKSLNGVGRRIFVFMVNGNLSAVEISGELGLSQQHVNRVMKVIRKKALKYFYCPERSTAITERVTSQGFY